MKYLLGYIKFACFDIFVSQLGCALIDFFFFFDLCLLALFFLFLLGSASDHSTCK